MQGEEDSNEELRKSVSCKSFHLLLCVGLAGAAKLRMSGASQKRIKEQKKQDPTKLEVRDP